MGTLRVRILKDRILPNYNLYYPTEDGNYPKTFFVIAQTQREALEQLNNTEGYGELSCEEKLRRVSSVYFINRT